MERTAYREGGTRCAACSQQMQEQPIEGEMVDVCDGCGGVWIDPSDGDIGDIATYVRIPEAATGESPDPSLPRTCPRCAVPLAAVLMRDVALFRCDSCRGTFLPRAVLDAAMWLREGDDAPPPRAIDGLRGWMRVLLGR